MLECLILGDSLAVGIGQARTECVTYARSGINSYNYVNRHILYTNSNQKEAKTVIISLGSNDLKNINTFEELSTLRQLVRADRVYWILPAIKESKRQAVQEVADKFNDQPPDMYQAKMLQYRLFSTDLAIVAFPTFLACICELMKL